MSEKRIRAAVTTGDPNGIGLEVIMKTFQDPRMMQVCEPVIYGSAKVISAYKKELGLNEFQFSHGKEFSGDGGKQPHVINCTQEDFMLQLGKASPEGGKQALASLEAAVADLKAGKADILITAPIDKNSIQSESFKFPGHTEYLAQQFEAKEHIMLLVDGDLRVGIATGHVPISKVPSLLGSELILRKLKIMAKSLTEDFGIRKPRIAVLGLNPHAGDNGLIGNEEEKIISPAIRKAREAGVMAIGPYAADGFFGSGNFKNFDAVLAMYHDQGLAPFKALSFGSGVNYTAGLSAVRTSPDHGTGFDIAGKNVADESSFRQAVYTACDVFNHRQSHKEITANPLKFTHLRKENS
jgi:4-hydroxythreonine-4-phosphate dehydrogenase